MMMDECHPLLQLDVEWWTNNFGHPNPRRFSLKIANLAMTLI
jgi:hypothetical protein